MKDLTDIIPAALAEADRWLLWKSIPNPGKKPRKAPFYADGRPRNGQLDGDADGARLVDLGTAQRALRANPGEYAGLGIALGPNGRGDYIQGIDLDGVEDNGLHAVAQSLPGYVERSPSGEGLHALGIGVEFRALGSNGTGVEAYCGKRYFTVTGETVRNGELADLAPFVAGTLAPLHGRAKGESGERGESPLTRQQYLDLRSALAAVPADDRAVWVRFCIALKPCGTQGRALWVEWSQTSAKYDPEDAARVWTTAKPNGELGIASIFREAQQRGWANPAGVSYESDPLFNTSWPDPNPLPERGGASDRPFPLHLLPTAVRNAAQEVSRFSKVPDAAPALVGVSVVATAIGKRAVIEERPGLEHYPALFLAGIASTGERKTPVFQKMTRPLEDWSEQRRPSWEADVRMAKSRNTVIDHAINVAKRKAKKAGDVQAITEEVAELEAQRIPIPPAPRLFTTDATEQRVFQMMHDRQGAFAVMSGEGRPVLDAIMGKYSGPDRTGDAIYLAGISGDTTSRDRVGGEDGPEDRIIRKPCLNTCVLVQPDKYLEAASHPSLRAAGTLARIWPVWLPSLVGTRFEQQHEPGLNVGCFDGYNALVRYLLKFEPENGKPHKAVLGAEAAEARRAFHNEVEAMLVDDGLLEDVKDIACKAVSQTCKLALCLHLAERPHVLAEASSTVGIDTWRAAQAIGTWFLYEAIRVQRMADEDPTLKLARRIVAWLAKTRRKTVTGSNLMQFAPRPRPKAKEAADALEFLAGEGYLRPENNPSARKPVYAVHPLISHFSQISRGRGENEKYSDTPTPG